MRSEARTVEQYVAQLPEERRQAVSALRRVILKNLPRGYEEGMAYGMIGYHVPHSVYPPGYHCNPEQPLPFAALASQKNHIALYLFCMYSDTAFESWFREAWTRTGKKLDMGKSCVRFKKLDDVPLELVGEAVKKIPVNEFIAFYEAVIAPPAGRGKRATASGKGTASPGPARRKRAASPKK